MSMRKSILEVIKQKGEASLSDLYAALPAYPKHSVRSEASALVKQGVLRRVRKGVYALAETEKEKAAAGESTVRETGWEEKITGAIRQGCTTYSSLCSRFGREKGHVIRSVISRLKKKGVVISPRRGVYQLVASSARKTGNLKALEELAWISAEELALLADLVPEGSTSLKPELMDAAQALSRRGMLKIEHGNVLLTPKGIHFAAFLRSYLNLRRRSSGDPGEEDLQAELWRLARLLEEVSARREEMLSALNSIAYAVESISSNMNRLLRLARSQEAG